MFILKPLTDLRIASLWGAQLLSATGAEFYMVAVIWIASSLIGREAGYISGMQAAALFVGSLFGGIVTDRWRHSATMIAVSLIRAILLLVLSLASAFDAMSLPLLAITAGCVALATAVYDPALQASLPILAPEPAKRHAVNGLFDATRRMARIIGPSLIALVNGLVPIGQFFTITAAAFMLSALGVNRGLKGMNIPAPATGRGSAALDAVSGGALAVRRHRLMYYALFADFVGSAAWSMGLLLGMALYLRATSASSLTDYGLMMTAYGIGNLAANIVLAGRCPKRPLLWLVTAKLTFGLGVMLMPFAPDRIWLMAFAAFAAVNGPFEHLAQLHITQHDFPLQQIAQVYRLQICAASGGLLVGYLAAPSLFALLGIGATITMIGSVTLITGVIGLGLARRGRMDQHGP
jgi:DHA3 family macrolide efflux protein-like MFS transporter